MPRKADTSDDKGRGSCCTLEAVKQFLQRDTIPEGYTKNDKRALRRRAKSFVLIGEELYFTGGRSRHNKGLTESETGGAENPENEPDHTQVLRKVVFSEEQQQEIINEAHVGEDGSHHGMERTTERVSNQYYWLGIIYGVRNTIHNCQYCSSRIKNPGRSLTFPAGHESTTTSHSNNVAVASSTASKSSEIPKILEEEMADGSGQGADDIDVNVGEDGFSELSATDSHSMKQEVESGPADIFAATKEICSHFWQKVEIQIFGPYQAGKKMAYVAVALDSYSQFPEAVTMEVLSSATLTHFFLSLFCRYGAMEKLLLLQNQVTRNKDIYINLQDVLQAGISPSLLFPHVNPLDERWNHIEKSLVRFISLYPDFWFHCLEAFMVPLRITLPPEAIYSPYYLVHGREPPVPDKLNQLCNVNSSGHTEVQLTEDQEKQTVEMVTAAYGIYSENPSIPVTLPEPLGLKASTQTSCLKESIQLNSASKVEMAQQQEKWLHEHQDLKSTTVLKRRRGRPRLKEEERRKKRRTEIPDEKEEATEDQTKREVADVSEFCDPGIDADDDSDKDATYEPEVKSTMKKSLSVQPVRSSGRQRKATYKAQASEIFTRKSTVALSKHSCPGSSKEVVPSSTEEKTQEICPGQRVDSLKTRGQMKNPKTSVKISAGDTSKRLLPKKKRGRPCKNVSRGAVELPVFTKIKFGSKKLPLGLHSSIIKNMQQLSVDTFYFIIKQSLEHGVFPHGVSEDTKQSVRSLCSMFYLKDGKLYSGVGKSAGRHIIAGEKTRFSLLRKAHARGEVHHGRASVLKYLSDLNVFWNGMSLDLDAFIHSCPECICHNPLGNVPVVHIPSKSAILTLEGRKEDEPHISEDEEEESSYEDLIQYLTDTTFPPTTSPHQQQRIQERSKSFRIIKGSLYYQTQRMTEPLQVLFSESLKFSAIREAHLEDGQHLSQQDTQAKLRRQYFWSGMTFDVLKHVMACCTRESLSTLPVLHRNPVIQERVDKFRSYYTDVIPKLDVSAITATDMESRQTEELTTTRKRQHSDRESPGKVLTSDAGHTKEKRFSAADEATTSSVMNKDIVKAVENIIEDIGKSLTGDKTAKPAGNGEGKTTVLSPFGSVRSRKDAHKCQYCGKFISGNVAYRIHLYKHTGVKPFTCSTCGKSFTTSKSLQVHTRKHTGVKPYLCNQCGREFFRGTSFKYHLKTHSRAQLKPLPCDECNREFLTKNRLDKHKQYKHPAEPKVFMCEHCGKIFMHSRSLKTHEQSHIFKYTCQICKKEFSRSDQLESHTKVAHTDQPKAEKASPKSSVPSQSQEHLQQQLLPHILYTTPQTQLVQTIDLNSGGNINEIQWREEEHQQAPQHIIITECPSRHITIEHPSNVMEQVANHITISEQGGGGITINSHAADHITISEHAGTQIRITEDAGACITMDKHQMPENRHEVKDLGTYHTPPFSQPSHTTTHILTQVQLPLSSSQAPLAQPNPVSSAATHLQSLHNLQPAAEDVLLQQEAVPVQYEVECLPDPNLTEADLSAVQLLAQASIAGQNITLRQTEEF